MSGTNHRSDGRIVTIRNTTQHNTVYSSRNSGLRHGITSSGRYVQQRPRELVGGEVAIVPACAATVRCDSALQQCAATVRCNSALRQCAATHYAGATLPVGAVCVLRVREYASPTPRPSGMFRPNLGMCGSSCHAHARSRTHARTRAHVHAPARAHTLEAHRRRHARTHSDTLSCTHARTHARTQSETHSLVHARTRARTHAGEHLGTRGGVANADRSVPLRKEEEVCGDDPGARVHVRDSLRHGQPSAPRSRARAIGGTRTRARACSRTHQAHTDARICPARTRACTYTHTRSTHACTHQHTHERMNARTLANTRASAHTHTHARTHAHTHARTHACNTHTPTGARTHTHARTQTRTHLQPHHTHRAAHRCRC